MVAHFSSSIWRMKYLLLLVASTFGMWWMSTNSDSIDFGSCAHAAKIFRGLSIFVLVRDDSLFRIILLIMRSDFRSGRGSGCGSLLCVKCHLNAC